MSALSWSTVALKRYASVVNGGTPGTDDHNWNGDVPWATPVDLGKANGGLLDSTERTLTVQGLVSGSAAVPAGSCLLSTRAPIGYAALVGTETAFNQGCKGVVPRAGLNSRFLLYTLLAAQPRLVALGQGSTFSELSASALGALQVQVPALSAQEAIANFLDRETAHIDEFIAEQEDLVGLLQERQSALIAEVVTGQRRGTGESGKIEWLESLPQHWSAIAIRDMARQQGTIFADGDWIESPFIQGSGVRLIQTGNVGVGRFREQGFRYISDQAFIDLKCTEVLPGDILISRLGEPVSRACLAPDLGVRMITSVDVAILRPGPSVERRYVNYALNSAPFLGWVGSLVRGSTRNRVSRSMLGSFVLPQPPFPEQVDLADELDALTSVLDATIADAREAIALSKERRAALITAAVTGQIDVTEKKRVLV